MDKYFLLCKIFKFKCIVRQLSTGQDKLRQMNSFSFTGKIKFDKWQNDRFFFILNEGFYFFYFYFFVYLGRKVMAWITVWLQICFKTLKNAVKTPLRIQLPSKHTNFIYMTNLVANRSSSVTPIGSALMRWNLLRSWLWPLTFQTVLLITIHTRASRCTTYVDSEISPPEFVL